jgi:hypothetical protein
MNNSLHFSSANQNWATRWHTFYDIQKKLNRDYLIDPCCEGPSEDDEGTAKCPLYITKEDDMFSVGRFRDHFKIEPLQEVHVFANPEYARQQVKFVKEFINQIDLDGNMVIDVLIPARPDTQLFHDTILKHATTIRFVRGRVVFGSDAYWKSMWKREFLEDGRKNTLYKKHGKMNPAAFPSMVVSFGERINGEKKPLSFETLGLTKAVYPDIVGEVK